MKLLSLFSVDEQKLSALILCLFVLVGIAGYHYGDIGISENMKDLIETMVFAVAGMNVANIVKGGKQ